MRASTYYNRVKSGESDRKMVLALRIELNFNSWRPLAGALPVYIYLCNWVERLRQERLADHLRHRTRDRSPSLSCEKNNLKLCL